MCQVLIGYICRVIDWSKQIKKGYPFYWILIQPIKICLQKCYITWDDNKYNRWQKKEVKISDFDAMLPFLFFILTRVIKFGEFLEGKIIISPWNQCWLACLRRTWHPLILNREFREISIDSCLLFPQPWRRCVDVPSQIASDARLYQSLPESRFLQ